MNFFYHNDDPLLSRYNSQIPNSIENGNNINDTYSQIYKQQLLQEMQQKERVAQDLGKDWIGELDNKLKRLKPDIVSELNKNVEFNQLNNSIQNEIQSEIISLVKFKLNSSSTIRDNVKRQMEIIEEISDSTQEEERKNMLELNDYLKNYSHLTFDEYKKIKNGESPDIIKKENKTDKKSKGE